MGWQKGERQSQRSRVALEKAFMALLREKNYTDITIHQIIERAELGRSTFYRHFQSKADVLVGFHEQLFSQLLAELQSQEAWLCPQPSATLVEFLERYNALNSGSFSMSYKLGKDLDYVLLNINKLLARVFASSLQTHFGEAAARIPWPVVAQSLAANYSWLLLDWLTQPQRPTPQQMATYIQQLSRGLVLAALSEHHEQLATTFPVKNQ